MGVRVKEKPKGSGTWWVFINHQGKRTSRKIGTDEDVALDVAKKIEARLVLEEFDIEKGKSKTSTFKEYADTWLNGYIKELRRPSTHERYSDILTRYVYPTLASRPLDQIKRGDIRALLLGLHKKGLSRATLALVRDVLNGPMSYAVDEEIIASNPVSGVIKRLNLKRDKRTAIEPLTREEVKLFLDTCEAHHPEFYPFFLCAFRTGARLGELLALQWGDVDWNGRFIEVRRSYKIHRVSPTKTGKVRRVDMSDHLTETLQALYTARKREALKEGKGEPVEIVFHKNGEHMEQNFIRHIFKRILRKAGIREIRFHDIRHTYASLLLSDGQSPVYVKEQMGHHSISVTVDLYGHWIPSSNRDAVNRLDAHPTAPQAQPEKNESLQPIEVTGFNGD
jgi:integrase